MEKTIILNKKHLERVLFKPSDLPPMDCDHHMYFTLLLDAYMTLNSYVGLGEQCGTLAEVLAEEVRAFCFYHSGDINVTDTFIDCVVRNALKLQEPLWRLGQAMDRHTCEILDARVDEYKVIFTTKIRPMGGYSAQQQSHSIQ